MKDQLAVKYFVLSPYSSDASHAAASRAAMRTYAEEIKKTHPKMSADLQAWAEQE